MGLDMYLSRKHYVKNWDHMTPEQRHQVTVLKNGKPTNIQPERVSYVIEQVAYWRKANQIHQWFVDNCQGGEDDCRDAYVSREQLIELRDTCRKVMEAIELKPAKVCNGWRGANGKVEPILEDGETIVDAEVASELLPTAKGFFFGSTDYDQYYAADVRETVEMLDKILAEPDGGDFYYHSSW